MEEKTVDRYFSRKKLSLIKVSGLIIVLGLVSCGMVRDIFYPYGKTDWYSSLDEALKDEGDRPVLLFFHSEFECPYCQKVIEKVLTDPQFVERSKHFRCVHYNVQENQDLVRRFRISGHPAFLVLDKNEKVIDKQIGYNLRETLALLGRHSRTGKGLTGQY